MDKQEIHERLDTANDLHQLADVIYKGIPELIAGLVNAGAFVDNGIAVMPYEEFDMNSLDERDAVIGWETHFISKAFMLAFQRWIDENTTGE
jgi:hypothetical protein